MAVNSSGDVIFGFGTEDIYTPGAYKMFSSTNAVLNTPDSVGNDATIGATAVANQGGSAPTFAPLPGGGFATVGYTPVGTYNASGGYFPSFTMNIQTVSTTGAITTRDTVTHAVEDNYYQTANVNWISVLPDGTVEFQEMRDNDYYHDANLADSYTVGGTLDRGSVTLPLPSDGNTPFPSPRPPAPRAMSSASSSTRRTNWWARASARPPSRLRPSPAYRPIPARPPPTASPTPGR